MCFFPKLVPPATWGVWGRLPTLQLLWGLNDNQMGNLSVGAWSTPIPSLISTVLRTAPYTLESSRQVLYSEWWRQSWSLKKRWTAAPCYPKVKGREDSKGLLSCRRGNPSWVAKEPFYSHTMSLLILRQEVTSLLLRSRAPCGIRLRLRLLLKCQLCLLPTPPLSCTLHLHHFFYLETSLWQSLALRSLAWSLFCLTPL